MFHPCKTREAHESNKNPKLYTIPNPSYPNTLQKHHDRSSLTRNPNLILSTFFFRSQLPYEKHHWPVGAHTRIQQGERPLAGPTPPKDPQTSKIKKQPHIHCVGHRKGQFQ